MAPALRPMHGVTLVELLVALVVFALLLMLAGPSLGQWMRDSRVRSVAQALQNDLQFTRAEAVKRNSPVRLQLVTSLDNTCAISSGGPYWVVNLGANLSPASSCDATPSETASPQLRRVSPRVSSTATTTLSATRAVVAFDGLGRQTDTLSPATSASTLTIQVADGSSTCAPGGSTRCLSLYVTTAGDIRMCDPARPTGQTASDAMSCP